MQQIHDDESAAALATVERFCSRSIAPLFERPERVVSQEGLDQLAAAAREAGIVAGSAGEDGGLGLWESPTDVGLRQLSIATLIRIAAVNAGAAFHLHQLALGRHLILRLGLVAQAEDEVVPYLERGRGAAWGALARVLGDSPLEPGDDLLLDELFGRREQPAILQAAEGWRAVIAPTFVAANHEIVVRWQLWDRASLEASPRRQSHGLNETTSWLIREVDGASPGVDLEHGEARQVLCEALQIDSVGLIAIGLGAVRAGIRKAREYAKLRVQGGSIIQRHPAVQLMLGRAESNARTVQLLLDALCRLPLSPESLASTLAARANAHPLLCAAANEALQAFGGLGYMQDTGLEKIVRDNNHLRLLHGTPDDLRLFSAQWEVRS